MGIAKSKNTVSGTHGGGRIRSSLARAAEATGSAIGRLWDESTISEGMPSWWFPISKGNFAASDGDPDETSRRTLSGLPAEPERLTGDPAYALWFFTTKIGGEWLASDFESRFFGGQSNYSIGDDAGTPLDADDNEISYFRRTPRRYVNYRIAKEISGDDWFGNASPEKRRRAVEIERTWDGVSYPWLKLLGFLSCDSLFSM